MQIVSKCIGRLVAFLCCLSLELHAQKQSPPYAPMPHRFGRNLSSEVVHLSAAHGLSNSTIYTILQDRQGFIWIATEDGLNRYDGYTIKVYKHDPFDSTSLSNNSVFTLYEDRSGVLWIGTRRGLNRFNRHTETFSHFVRYPTPNLNLARPPINGILEDRDGRMWLSTAGVSNLGALHLFDRRSGKVIRSYRSTYANRTAYWINAMDVDSAGTLWLATDSGVERFDPRSGDYLNRMLEGIWINNVYCDPYGSVWCSTIKGLYRIDIASGAITAYRHDPSDDTSLSHDFIQIFYFDRDGRGWVGTAAGIDLFDRATETFQPLPITPRAQQVNSNSINTLFEDKTGVLWVGTRNNGVFRYDRKPRRFSHYLPDPSDPAENDIQTLYEDRSGRIWAALRTGGVLVFDPELEAFERIGTAELQKDVIDAILEDHLGMIWLGGILHGLYVWNPRTRSLKHYQHDSSSRNSLSHNRVTRLLEDRDGTLWIGTSNGLNRFDRTTETFTHFRAHPANTYGENTVLEIHEDQAGTLWVAMNKGVHIFDRKNETFKTIHSHIPYPAFYNAYLSEDSHGNIWVNSERHGMLLINRKTLDMTQYLVKMKGTVADYQNLISTIQEDRAGTLWLGSFMGLHQFDPHSKRFLAHYYERDGLLSNYITHMVFDNDGKLWILTARGLTLFDPRAPRGEQFRSFGLEHGVLNNTRFWRLNTRLLKAKNGDIYWGGVNGLYRFYPDVKRVNPMPPPVRLTELRIFDQPALLDSALYEKKVLRLSHKQNFFTLRFAALDYSNPRLNHYAYKLEGFDRDWVQAGNRNQAQYTNVPPGTYTFRVKASNNDGVWNEEGASVRIIITPPWWQTKWAYAGYVLLLGLALYGLRRFELNRIHMRNELKRREFEARKLQELDEMRSRFFANVSHEFRTPLTLILGPLETLLSRIQDRETKKALLTMRRNARRLQKLINQLLDLSKLQSGRMPLRARAINAVAFVRKVTLAFTSLAERKQIQLSFSAPEKELRLYADRDKLEKIVSNLISNALKFTPKYGKVRVTVAPVRNTSGAQFVEITVSDTGVGIAPEHLEKIFDRFYQVDDSSTRTSSGTGIGLSLAKELVELHSGRIWAESEPGKGARFIVHLPMGKAHFRSHEVAEVEADLPEPDPVFSDEDMENEHGRSLDQTVAPKAARILVVEDNADMRHYIRSHLQTQYHVLDAANGASGLELARTEIPDVIVSDVMMPGLDGFALCEKLKSDPRTSHIPIILLTARASGESKIEGLETGADDYITKPFDMRELLARIKNLLEQRERLREWFQREFILQPREVDVISADEKFLRRAMEMVEAHLADPEFSVERFTRMIGMSAMQLHRKLKALTGQSATQFIRSIRLRRAAKLIEKQHGNMAEIAFAVGFNNPSYFAARFREQYGVPPSQYAMRFSSTSSSS